MGFVDWRERFVWRRWIQPWDVKLDDCLGYGRESTLKAGNERSWSLVRSSVSVTGIFVFGRVKVDIFAEACGFNEERK